MMNNSSQLLKIVNNSLEVILIFEQGDNQISNLEQAKIQELEQENEVLKEKLIQKAGRKRKVSEEIELDIQRLCSYGNSMNFLAKKFELLKGTIFNIVRAD